MGTYFSSLYCDFVFDDNALVVENPFIKDFNYAGKIFTTSLFDTSYDSSKPNYYRPLQLASFMLDYRVWKLNPFGYHLTNVLLHFFNAFLVFSLICLLFENFSIAVFSSVLFCVHPINTTAVTYISGRADLLVSLFILAMFFCATLGAKFNKGVKFNFSFAVLFFVLALLSRESAVIAPLGLLLLSFFIKSGKRYWICLFLTLSLLFFIYLYIRVAVLNISFSGYPVIQMPFYFRLINFLSVIFSYLFLLVVPVNLYLMHIAKPISHVFDIRLLGVFFLSYALIMFCYFKRRDKIVIFSVIWFFIFILPVYFLMANFSAKITMAEHWVYLSSVGFYIIAGKAIIYLKSHFKNLIYPLIAVVFLIYIALTVVNNANFRDRVVLAKRVLQFNSDNKEARKDLAYVYLYNKQYDLAIEQIEKALKLVYFDEELYLLQGVYYENTGKSGLAVSSYEKILEKNPRSSRAINNLAGIFWDSGNLDKAEALFKQSIEINPLSYEAYFNLAKLNYQKKVMDKAVFFYEKALGLNPSLNEAALTLAQIYKEQGDVSRAINTLKSALGVPMPDAKILLMLGMLTAQQGANDKAEYYFKQALRLDPGSDEALFNLGVFYANNNQLDKAVKVWQEALNNNPDNKKIKDYMERAQQLLSP